MNCGPSRRRPRGERQLQNPHVSQVPTRRSTLPTGRLSSGNCPGQQLRNARLVAGPHVSAAAPESSESGAARMSGRVSGRPALRLSRRRSGLASAPAAYASAACSSHACWPCLAARRASPASVRLVRRAQREVPGLRHDQRLLVDAAGDEHQPLGGARHDPVVGGERRGGQQLGVHHRGDQQRRHVGGDEPGRARAAGPPTRRRAGGRAARRAPTRRRRARAAGPAPAAATGSGPAPSDSSWPTAGPTPRPPRPRPRRGGRRAWRPTPRARRWRARPAAATPPSSPGVVRRSPRSRSIASMPSRAAARADGTPSRACRRASELGVHRGVRLAAADLPGAGSLPEMDDDATAPGALLRAGGRRLPPRSSLVPRRGGRSGWSARTPRRCSSSAPAPASSPRSWSSSATTSTRPNPTRRCSRCCSATCPTCATSESPAPRRSRCRDRRSTSWSRRSRSTGSTTTARCPRSRGCCGPAATSR